MSEQNNTVNNKRIAKNTIILYLRMLIMMAVSLYTSRIVLSALGIDDFGIYNVVGGVVTCIAFLNGTLNTATSRYITIALGKDDPKRSGEIFSSILIVNILIGAIIVFACETIGVWFLYEKMNIPCSRINAAFWVFQLSVITIFFNIISVPYNATIIAHEKMKAFAYITLIDAFAKLLFAFLLTYIESFDRLIMYAFFLCIIQFANQLINFKYCIQNFTESRFKFYVEKSLIKEIWKFISWSAYGSIVSMGFTQGLNILLNVFFGPALNAARGIAVQVQNAIVAFTVNFQTAINPQLFKTYARLEFERTQKLLMASSIFSFYLLCIFGLPIIGNAKYILSLWLRDVPEHTIAFVQLMLVICMFQSLANPLRIVNQAEGNIKKFQLYECTYLALIVPFAYFALKKGCNAEFVFIIQLFIEITAQFIRLYIVLPKIGMTFSRYFYRIYLKNIPIFVLLLFVIYYLPTTKQTFAEFVVNSFILETILLCLICSLGLSTDERKLIVNKIKREIRKK